MPNNLKFEERVRQAIIEYPNDRLAAADIVPRIRNQRGKVLLSLRQVSMHMASTSSDLIEPIDGTKPVQYLKRSSQ